jgi:hypothetical protein
MKWGTKIKYFRSDDIGAPERNGIPGSMISLLDAVLVNGYNQQEVLSAEIVEGNVVISCTVNNPFKYGQVVKLEGANNNDLNREYRIIEVNNNICTLEGEDLNDGPITGDINASLAPLGWIKPFSNVSKGVYRSSNPISSGYYYRVDDTPAQWTFIDGFMTMDNMESGKGRYPVDSEVQMIGKSDQANVSPRFWMIIGDDRGFYMFTNPSNRIVDAHKSFSYTSRAHFIGDYVDSIGDNNYNSCLACYRPYGAYGSVKSNFNYSVSSTSSYTDFYFTNINNYASSSQLRNLYRGPGTHGTIALAKNYDYTEDFIYGISGAYRRSHNSTQVSGASHTTDYFPDLYTGKLPITDTYIYQEGVRGKLPGYLYIDSFLNDNFVKYNFIPNTYNVGNRKLFSVYISYGMRNINDLSITHGFMLIDFDEWRNKVW